MTQRTEYTFNASAIALGGYFTRGGRQILVPSLASVALAPTGGEGWANVTNYDQDGIAFTRAESRVSGYETSRNFFTTYSDIYITNLSVFDTVRVAMMHAAVTSTRDTNCPADEATFQLHASYRGIEIDGYEVVPEIDIHTCGADYRSLLKKALAELPDADRNLSVASRRDALERGEPIRDTIVKGLKHGCERD
ncbi:MAG TPA: hypothetical protein VE010_07205, partial [Thermoanaerobaculia bacterium]|nr:hypothetical protein [Thermoanaerobaculia bacterium]